MKWNTVSSNTTVALFEKFLTASPAFQYNECDLNFKLHSLNPQDTCKLHYIIEPLNWVTEKLLSKVVSHKDTVTGITRTGNDWTIKMSSGSILTQNVVLAIGSKPREMKMKFQSLN